MVVEPALPEIRDTDEHYPSTAGRVIDELIEREDGGVPLFA